MFFTFMLLTQKIIRFFYSFAYAALMYVCRVCVDYNVNCLNYS